MAEAKKKSVMKACLLAVGVKQNSRVDGYTGVVETCDKSRVARFFWPYYRTLASKLSFFHPNYGTYIRFLRLSIVHLPNSNT